VCVTFSRGRHTPECRDEESGVIEHFMCARTEKTLAKVAALRKISLSKYLRCKALGKYFSANLRSHVHIYVGCLESSSLSYWNHWNNIREKKNTEIYIYITFSFKHLIK